MLCWYQKPEQFNKDVLNSYATKVLLKWKYRSGDMPFYRADCYCEICDNLDNCRQIALENQKIVKEILSKRPHILNKKESKLKRQKAAKEKK